MFQKTIIILIVVSALKLMTSCIFRCDCPNPEEVEFTLNTSHISLIDNAGPYPDYHTDSDSLSSRAIGFNITLSDSTMADEYYAALPDKCKHTAPIFIKGAYAWSCDCVYWEFKAKQKLKTIRLIALTDFNQELPAQTDISHLLVGRADQSGFEGHGMYKTLDKTIDYLSEERIYNSPDLSFELYLTEAPTADSIRFEITFEFDDNSFITDSTETIYPIPQFEL
jgi:hypothetical protein